MSPKAQTRVKERRRLGGIWRDLLDQLSRVGGRGLGMFGLRSRITMGEIKHQEGMALQLVERGKGREGTYTDGEDE